MSDFRRIWWWPPLPASARVLEIGSGAGDFVRAARERGWVVDHFDPATGGPTAEAWAASAGVVPYDAVFAWQVVEHLTEPLVVVQAIRQRLRRRGYFVLSVPSARCVEAWLLAGNWEARHPGHLTEWTPWTLRRVLRGCGFGRVRILHQRIVKHVRGPWWVQLALGCLVAACRCSSRITVVARP